MKVYKFNDFVLGYNGPAAGFISWLKNDLNEASRLGITERQIIEKAEEIMKFESTLLNVDLRFGIVLSDFERTSIVVGRVWKIENYEIPTKEDTYDPLLTKILSKEIFFSPIYEKNIISINHNNSLLELFKQLYIEIYKKEFDVESIENDDRLEILLNDFYDRINDNDYLNKACIKGDVKYYVIDLVNFKISKLQTRILNDL